MNNKYSKRNFRSMVLYIRASADPSPESSPSLDTFQELTTHPSLPHLRMKLRGLGEGRLLFQPQSPKTYWRHSRMSPFVYQVPSVEKFRKDSSQHLDYSYPHDTIPSQFGFRKADNHPMHEKWESEVFLKVHHFPKVRKP